MRLTLSDVATIEELRDAVADLTEAVTDAVSRIETQLEAGLDTWPTRSRLGRRPDTGPA